MIYVAKFRDSLVQHMPVASISPNDPLQILAFRCDSQFPAPLCSFQLASKQTLSKPMCSIMHPSVPEKHRFTEEHFYHGHMSPSGASAGSESLSAAAEPQAAQ